MAAPIFPTPMIPIAAVAEASSTPGAVMLRHSRVSREAPRADRRPRPWPCGSRDDRVELFERERAERGVLGVHRGLGGQLERAHPEARGEHAAGDATRGVAREVVHDGRGVLGSGQAEESLPHRVVDDALRGTAPKVGAAGFAHSGGRGGCMALLVTPAAASSVRVAAEAHDPRLGGRVRGDALEAEGAVRRHVDDASHLCSTMTGAAACTC